MGASDPPPEPPLEPRPPAAPPDTADSPQPPCALSVTRHQSQRLRQRTQVQAVSPAAPRQDTPQQAHVSPSPVTTSPPHGDLAAQVLNIPDLRALYRSAPTVSMPPVDPAPHPPGHPFPTDSRGGWLDEPSPRAKLPARPFSEHQHQRLFPLFQRSLPLLVPLFPSPSQTPTAFSTSRILNPQSDVPMPLAPTSPPAQAPSEQTPAATVNVSQPLSSLQTPAAHQSIISLDTYQKRKRDDDHRATSAKRIAPITTPVAAPLTSQPTPSATHTPTKASIMADTQQDTDVRESAPQGTSHTHPPTGPSASPKRPGLDEIRDECHPPVPYPNDALFWEAEDELFPVLTDEEINNIETAFADSNNTLVFHLNPDDASKYNIVNFREEITNDCKYFFNITFPVPLTGSSSAAPVLMGMPNERHIEAWSAAKRGYLLLPKVMILVSYQHAAHIDPPQSLNQLEYSNTDYMSPNEIRKAFQVLGAADYIVCSHSRNGSRRTERWPSIGCINRQTDKLFKFRVMFPNQALTELVYANYHALRRTQSTHLDIPNSLQLRRLSEIQLDQPTQTFFHPILPANSHLRDTKLRLSPVPPSIRPVDIAQVLAEHVFDNTDVDITGTVATLTFYNTEIRDIAWQTWRNEPLIIRDYPLAVSALTGALQQPPQSSTFLTCRDCGRLGHIASECTVFQELDDRGRPLRTQATPATNTAYDPRRDTTRSQARPGRSLSTPSANLKGRSASHGPTQMVATKPTGHAGATMAVADVRRLQECFLRVEAETKRHSEELARVQAENAAHKAQIEEQAAQLAAHAARHAVTQLALEEQARVQAQAADDRQAMKANIAQAIALLSQAASAAAQSTPPNSQQN